MAYRDDREADQARIEALERELEVAQEKLAVLEGRQSQALVLASPGALVRDGGQKGVAWWFGAPGQLQFARRFDGAFPAEQFEELVERIREVTRDPGRTELLRSSLTWFASRAEKSPGPYRVVTVTVRDGVTTLTVTDRLAGLAGAIYGGVGGGVRGRLGVPRFRVRFGGAGGGVAPLGGGVGGAGGGGLSLPILAATAVPVLAPVFILGWLGGVFLGTRAIYKRAARRRAVALQQLFDALVADIEGTLRK